jgi:hypothetical protein
MSISGTQIQFERSESGMGSATDKQGYLLKITEPLSDESLDTLAAHVTSGEILGKSVDALTLSATDPVNGQGSVEQYSLPAGYVVAANTVEDLYGNNVVTLMVFTGALNPQPPYYESFLNFTADSDFSIGGNADKELIYTGVVGEDFNQFIQYYSPTNDGKLDLQFTPGYGFNLTLSPETLALADVDLNGALLGITAPMSQYGGNFMGMDNWAPLFAYEIDSVTTAQDSYNNTTIKLTIKNVDDGMVMNYPSVYSYDENYKVFIVK